MSLSGSWFSRFRRKGNNSDAVSMMPCDELRASGSDYIDGECEEEIHSKIMEHLGLCTECDSWLKSFAMTVGLMRDTPEVEVPESTMERIRAIKRPE
ncbi:MAG: hypothetical protein HOC77_00100 [Chloroflexi bacterium]|jgi:predicted anti-sigma-YlaC factor YlaD|nr:hypothetical protein [Chloroflexota bacterium]MBT4074280.1 hypothetical protein [Chloroflexota bacterium]MBT4513476.1 hypothetical protein [Chloroflexota bacterium]MBT5319923.1 hypothetical protein [Chloroflexota bacterium]MBT6680966.1 hypothetical protein [Chloroflexota bacterium]